jgi:sulfatase maturation enzyme AslB (radical SAM superfamily)
MKKIIEIKRLDSAFYMYWTLTDFCNFRCNYCPSILHSGDFAQGRKRGFPSDDDINQFINNLINRHLRGRKLYLVLSGGEPTLHPMYATIIERLTPYGVVCTNTNGSRGVDWWRALPVLPQQVTISLHPEFSKVDKINEVAQFLLSKDIELQFNLSCDPNNWPATVALLDSLDDNLKALAVPKVLNHLESDRSNYEYTAEQNQWMTDQQNFHRANKGFSKTKFSTAPYAYYDDGSKKLLNNLAEITINKEHNFKGWACTAGDTSINAHFDGNVWGSICKSVNLGRLESFELLDAPVECRFNYCTCPGDILIDKRAP